MSLLLNARHIGCRLSGRFNCLSSLSSSSLPSTYQRQLHTKNQDDSTANTATHQASTTGMSLCQMNNHPDFRLRVAKQKFGGGGGANITVKKQPATAYFSSKSVPNYKKQVREGGLNIHLLENPVRSNDGTSSGAIINDRLRIARREMIEKMKTPVEIKEEATTEQSNSSQEGKMSQEKFWMDMWKDAGNEIKRLRGELKEESDEDAIADIQADIKGLRKRKAEFAKLLRMDE
mmetsp:Transcript_3091/g.5448  ORF Transcript_3091/g.5448 Transcript_3091/m.5448 type:complete len:233 (-) Transcript_3091:154-852(-)